MGVPRVSLARLYSSLTAQGGSEFRALTFAFQACNRDFGIGDHLPVDVNHGGPCPGELTFLGGDIGDLVDAVGIDGGGKHSSFSREVAGNLLTHGFAPELIHAHTDSERNHNDYCQGGKEKKHEGSETGGLSRRDSLSGHWWLRPKQAAPFVPLHAP
jgi:hypothetical protein